MSIEQKSPIAGADFPAESDSKSTLFAKARSFIKALIEHDHSPGKGMPIAASGGAVPSGATMFWPGEEAPSGWLLIEGQELSQTEYAGIFNVIGNVYNDGTESGGNFRMPKAAGRTILIAGTGSGLTARELGDEGGAETVQLITANVPSHTHTFSATTPDGEGRHQHHVRTTNYPFPTDFLVYANTGAAGAIGFGSGGETSTTYAASGPEGPPSSIKDSKHQHTVSGTTGTGSGSATAFNKMPPYVVMNAVMKI